MEDTPVSGQLERWVVAQAPPGSKSSVAPASLESILSQRGIRNSAKARNVVPWLRDESLNHSNFDYVQAALGLADLQVHGQKKGRARTNKQTMRPSGLTYLGKELEAYFADSEGNFNAPQLENLENHLTNTAANFYFEKNNALEVLFEQVSNRGNFKSNLTDITSRLHTPNKRYTTLEAAADIYSSASFNVSKHLTNAVHALTRSGQSWAKRYDAVSKQLESFAQRKNGADLSEAEQDLLGRMQSYICENKTLKKSGGSKNANHSYGDIKARLTRQLEVAKQSEIGKAYSTAVDELKKVFSRAESSNTQYDPMLSEDKRPLNDTRARPDLMYAAQQIIEDSTPLESIVSGVDGRFVSWVKSKIGNKVHSSFGSDYIVLSAVKRVMDLDPAFKVNSGLYKKIEQRILGKVDLDLSLATAKTDNHLDEAQWDYIAQHSWIPSSSNLLVPSSTVIEVSDPIILTDYQFRRSELRRRLDGIYVASFDYPIAHSEPKRNKPRQRRFGASVALAAAALLGVVNLSTNLVPDFLSSTVSAPKYAQHLTAQIAPIVLPETNPLTDSELRAQYAGKNTREMTGIDVSALYSTFEGAMNPRRTHAAKGKRFDPVKIKELMEEHELTKAQLFANEELSATIPKKTHWGVDTNPQENSTTVRAMFEVGIYCKAKNSGLGNIIIGLDLDGSHAAERKVHNTLVYLDAHLDGYAPIWDQKGIMKGHIAEMFPDLKMGDLRNLQCIYAPGGTGLALVGTTGHSTSDHLHREAAVCNPNYDQLDTSVTWINPRGRHKLFGTRCSSIDPGVIMQSADKYSFRWEAPKSPGQKLMPTDQMGPSSQDASSSTADASQLDTGAPSTGHSQYSF